uniref:BZIP domain-containing protein n=1 Tax=Parastrongyloides trichosuri TaxID=131310 RepID=A0A0N5A6M2_PARTI
MKLSLTILVLFVSLLCLVLARPPRRHSQGRGVYYDDSGDLSEYDDCDDSYENDPIGEGDVIYSEDYDCDEEESEESQEEETEDEVSQEDPEDEELEGSQEDPEDEESEADTESQALRRPVPKKQLQKLKKKPIMGIRRKRQDKKNSQQKKPSSKKSQKKSPVKKPDSQSR